MNWIDVNIICIGAKKPKIYKNDLYTIEVMNCNPNKSHKCYFENWDILNRIQGIWYELWTINNKDDFLINSTWKKNDKNDRCGYQLFVDHSALPFFENVFRFYINQSPIKKIIVLFRHQGNEYGYIENSMHMSDFLNRFVNKQIYGNIAYILEE